MAVHNAKALQSFTSRRLLWFIGCRRMSDKADLSLNGGLIEGVWIFTRHGDRTPSRSLCAPHRKEEEASFWKKKLPPPDPLSALKKLSVYFPPNIHESNGHNFVDVSRSPFGFLTKIGIDQLSTNGRRFFLRYDNHGHRCPTTGRPDPDSFLNSWYIRAYSTNYLRTILSVQCFLDGLLSTRCYNPMSSLLPDDPLSDVYFQNSKPYVDIRVRERATDNLNAFDRNPKLIETLVTEVASTEHFLKNDAKACNLAARLANFLPGLVRPGRKTFGGPSGINWVEATDHFVCCSSHGVRFSRFSEFENDDSAEKLLEAMEYRTILHLAWRFRQWYQYPPLLAEVAAPVLREVVEEMKETTGLTIQDRRPFSVYSCHDVTILALLYALGADFLADEEKGNWRYWPEYGSTLIFELVKTKDQRGSTLHVVRVLLNGKPVRVVNMLGRYGDTDSSSSIGPKYIGQGPMNLLTVGCFDKIVHTLEAAGV